MALSYDLAMQGYFALYASTMTTFPDQCVTGAPAVERAAGIANTIWGPTSPFPYWAMQLGPAWTPPGFFARMVGLCFGLMTLGRTHFGVSADAWTKQTVAFHATSLVPFAYLVIQQEADVWPKWVWQIQCVVNVLLALWGAHSLGLLGGGAKPKKSTRAKKAK